MAGQTLAARIEAHVQQLCNVPGTRHPGNPGNLAATGLCAATIAGLGWNVSTQEFACMDWDETDASLMATDGTTFTVHASPYSLPVVVTAPLVAIDNIGALASAELTGKILLLHGTIAAEPLAPKRYPFYNPEEHQRIISLLERAQPAALITASPRNPALAGALYPAPLFEDGDFATPSAYMTVEDALRLAHRPGQLFQLQLACRRIPGSSRNVIARRGPVAGPRIVFTAHIDTKATTPGALDNAAGVAVLLALAELLRDYAGPLGVELAILNGEDYYAASGELAYLKQAMLDDIALAINIDGVGDRAGGTALCSFGCASGLGASVERRLVADGICMPVEPWYQGDHMIFAMAERPTIALTSARYLELLSSVTHTAADRPELVDSRLLAALAQRLAETVRDGATGTP